MRDFDELFPAVLLQQQLPPGSNVRTVHTMVAVSHSSTSYSTSTSSFSSSSSAPPSTSTSSPCSSSYVRYPRPASTFVHTRHYTRYHAEYARLLFVCAQYMQLDAVLLDRVVGYWEDRIIAIASGGDNNDEDQNDDDNDDDEDDVG